MTGTTPAALGVVHDQDRQSFEIALPGGPAVLTYVRAGMVVVLQHTVVPVGHRGRGLAAELTRAALAWSAHQGVTVVPQCSYVSHWLTEHPGEIAVAVDRAQP